MIKPTTIPELSLSALALFVVSAIATIAPQTAAAQTTTNLECNGCDNSKDIENGSIQVASLAPGVAYGETVFVRSKGSKAANCKRLRKALARIKDASLTNPVLVRLERGTYNCRLTPLAMKAFVTIEGAGRGLSSIIGNPTSDQGVVTGANEAALRNLSVEHAAKGSGIAVAINTAGRRLSLTDVAVKVDSATASNMFGILVPGGVLELTNVSVHTNNPGRGGIGINATSGAKLNMMNVWVRNFSGAGNPVALQLFDSSATGHGVVFSSNIFGLLGVGNSVFELVGGTVIGGRGVAAGFTGSFTCVGVAKEVGGALNLRADDCS